MNHLYFAALLQILCQSYKYLISQLFNVDDRLSEVKL